MYPTSLLQAMGADLAVEHPTLIPALKSNISRIQQNANEDTSMETLLQMTPVVAAAGYSLVYLLAGGGVFGAFVIFVVAKMLGR